MKHKVGVVLSGCGFLDAANRIVSTAAFMCDARLKDISIGIHQLVAAIHALLDPDTSVAGVDR